MSMMDGQTDIAYCLTVCHVSSRYTELEFFPLFYVGLEIGL